MTVSDTEHTPTTNNVQHNIMPKKSLKISGYQRTDLREPQRYQVIIHNDDFTTMDFVVMILTTVFFKSLAEAKTLMLQVHHSGRSVVGTYTYDIALSKVNKATNMAREEGFPLRLSMEPEQ